MSPPPDSRHSARHAASSDEGITGGSRDPAALEAEIARLRGRIGDTLAALDQRLTNPDLSAEAARVIEDLIDGRPNPLVRLIASHPLPSLLIGIGTAWLGLATLRQPEGWSGPAALRQPEGRPAAGDGGAAPQARLPAPLIAGIVGGVAAMVRDGSATVQDIRALPGLTALQPVLRDLALQHEFSAAALTAAMISQAPAQADPLVLPARVHPVWAEVRQAAAAAQPTPLVQALIRAESATIDHFDEALALDLPGDLAALLQGHAGEFIILRQGLTALPQAQPA